MLPRPAFADLAGRLLVTFDRPGRQSYLLGENWSASLAVSELRPKPLGLKPFPGYAAVKLPWTELRRIVEHHEPTWQSALNAVAGIYVIADQLTGKLYVGSATGEGGIWGRWWAYAQDGHGGNRELQALLRQDPEYAKRHFQYGILEIADKNATTYLLERESFWKELLVTRFPFGHNAN